MRLSGGLTELPAPMEKVYLGFYAIEKGHEKMDGASGKCDAPSYAALGLVCNCLAGGDELR